MSFENQSAFMTMMNNDLKAIAMQQYGYASFNSSCSSQISYESAYYTALCNASQGYAGSYGSSYSTTNYRPTTGTYNSASWSSDYLI